MKTLITALGLTIAASAPAFADTALNGTVISTMGDASAVALHERERGIGNNGIVQATNGMDKQVDAARIYDPRDAGQSNGATRQVSQFTGTADATNFGAR
jgi:hypothetical protein